MADITNISALLLDNAGQPRRAAQKTLDWILTRLRARSVALYRIEGDDIALSLGMAIDSLSDLNAKEFWSHRSDPDGPMWDDEGTAVLVRTHPVNMLVYTDGVDKRTLDLPALVTASAIAASALTKSIGREDGGGIGMARREELLASLRLHEWNIARVSRARGVTRKTIYDQMMRFGISRERVAK